MSASQHSMQCELMREDIRVVYIMGAGRSGSTLLDALLGNHPDVVSVGELTNLHFAGWSNGEYCACGKQGNVCEFWSEVLREWKQRDASADVVDYIAMQKRFESFRFFGWIRWVRFFRERFFRSRRFQRFLHQTENLYAAIRQVSGKSIIVDSSKNPLRACLLSLIPGIDLRIVHLVRDGRAVAWSRKKAFDRNGKGGVSNTIPSRPIWFSVVYWMLVNLVAGMVRTVGSDNAMLVRYENLVTTPQVVLGQIATLANVDLTEVARAATAGESMRIRHIISGNRLRMAGSVTLQADQEWIQMLSRTDRRICWTLAGWMLQRYQYSRDNELASNSRRAA